MKTSIIGYPRVGRDRQLKFWIEDYFSGALTRNALKANEAALRQKQLQFLHSAGVGFIPSNDSSFYDNALDTACLFGVLVHGGYKRKNRP